MEGELYTSLMLVIDGASLTRQEDEGEENKESSLETHPSDGYYVA